MLAGYHLKMTVRFAIIKGITTYSILPITRTYKGPMKMVRVNECSSYPG